MRRPVALPAFVALAVCCFGMPAAAATGLELTWDAPADCPTRESVVAETERFLGPVDTLTPLIARAVVQQQPSGAWRLDLDTEGSGQKTARTFEAGTCDELARAAALHLSLALSEAAATVAPPPVAEPPPIAPEPTHSLRPRIVIDLGAHPESDFQLRPTAALSVGIVWNAWRFDLGARGELFTASPATGSGEARVQLLMGVLRGCHEGPSFIGLDTELCGNIEAGAWFATGAGFRESRSGSAPALAGVVGGALSRHLGAGISVELRLEAGLSAVAPVFVAEGAGTIYTAPLSFQRLLLGVVWTPGT